jgi:hypothetical protein
MWTLGDPTEFELQAIAYCALKVAGIEVRGEVTFAGPPKVKAWDEPTSARVDLLVLKDGQPKLVIEMKRRLSPSLHKSFGVDRQIERYERLTGLPCVLLAPEDVDRVVELVRPYLEVRSDAQVLLLRSNVQG